jgi:hypothetical protein
MDSRDEELLRAERMKFDPYPCANGVFSAMHSVEALVFFGAS